MLPYITSICATKGRHTCLERSVGMFILQDYPGLHTLMIYNNSEIHQQLSDIELPSNKQIILVNNYRDLSTEVPYLTLGAIYKDCLTYIPSNCNLITFWDDDDLFLPNHLTEGAKGWLTSGHTAYKPTRSYFRSPQGVVEAINNLEPSIFVTKEHIFKYGFKDSTSDQHLQWLDPLVKNHDIFTNPEGIPTLIYNWGDGNEIPTWKTSGDPNNPNNFHNYTIHSQDHGDQIVTPWNKERIIKLFSKILNKK